MATTSLVSFERLSQYDGLLKNLMSAEDAKAIKRVSYDSSTRVLSFYKTESAPQSGEDTPYATVTIPDTSSFISKIANPTAGDFVTVTSTGELVDAGASIDYDKILVAEGTGGASDVMLDDYIGSIPGTASSTTVIGYAAEVAAAEAADAISGVTGSATIASKSGNVVTIKAGVAQADAAISNDSGSDIVLAAVAATGAADDVTYDNTTSGMTATTVQDAIDELEGGLGTAAAANVATSAIQEESTDTGLVSAAQVATFVASEISGLEGAMHFVGVVNRQEGESDSQAIARVVTSPTAGDVIVMGDTAKEYIYDGTNWREVGDEGLYVQKSTTIAGVNLEDNITKTELLTALNVEDGAEENVIETVKVNGSALTPATKAVDILIVEGATNGTLAVNGTDVAVHGLGSAAYTDSTAYDAAGTAQGLIAALDADDIVYEEGAGGDPNTSVKDALDTLFDAIGSGGSVDDKISAAIEALDADVDASGTAQHSGTFVVSGITEVDGVITAVDSVEVEVAGAAAAAVAALDSNTSTATNTADSSLTVLTEIGIVDGIISTKKTNTLGSAATHADTDFMLSADWTVATEQEIQSLFTSGS